MVPIPQLIKCLVSVGLAVDGTQLATKSPARYGLPSNLSSRVRGFRRFVDYADCAREAPRRWAKIWQFQGI